MILGISEGSDEENEIVGRKRPKGKRKVSIHMVDFFLLFFFFFGSVLIFIEEYFTEFFESHGLLTSHKF